MPFPIDSAHGKTSRAQGWWREAGRERETPRDQEQQKLVVVSEEMGIALETDGSWKHRGCGAKQQGRYTPDIQEGHSTCKHGRARTGSMVGCRRGMFYLLPFPSSLSMPYIDWAFWKAGFRVAWKVACQVHPPEHQTSCKGWAMEWEWDFMANGVVLLSFFWAWREIVNGTV